MTDQRQDFLNKIIDTVRDADVSGLLVDRRSEGLSGISGLKTVGVLQRLGRLFAGDAAAAYLEIGVFQGLTLVSTALEAPAMPCFGIDNFRILDPDSKNKEITNERIERFGAANATLIDMDFEDALSGLTAHLDGRKIALYFVDGPHDYRSQIVCLLAALRYLHDDAVIVIDDANYPDVRRATRDFLTGHPEFKMVFEAYSPAHPANLDEAERIKWEEGWLNGVNILARDPANFLPEMVPPVDDDRTLYFNEWLVHRLRRAEMAPEAVALADAVCAGDMGAEEKARAALLEKYALWRDASDTRFPDRNTYSEGLTEGRFNEIP
ncbi:MAG: class I SAM-dependent methyltransferase [Rhodospirillales bacterium]|nr:class I SAM-dependent methyltransferase [Rhodospirillales bacterium]